MSTVTIPPPPEQDELQALIEEARRRARRRRAGYGALIAAGALLGGGLYVALGSSDRHPSSQTAVSARHLCSSSDWRLLPPGLNGAQGAVIGMVEIQLRGASGCRLRTELTFSVQRKTGTTWESLPSIRDNSEHTRLNAFLQTRNPIVHDWGWWDYCGARGRFRFRVTAGAQTAATIVGAPACETIRPGPWPAGGLGPFPPDGPR